MHPKLGLLASMCALGCGPSRAGDDLPPLNGQGERVQLGTDLVDEVCVGTMESLDRAVELTEFDLELSTSDAKLQVWVLPDTDIGEYCTLPASACTHAPRIYAGAESFWSTYHHELVHARLGLERPSVKPLFEEGLANAIGGGQQGCLGLDGCPEASLDELLSVTDARGLGVGLWAGSDLVHGMLAMEGPTGVLAFTRDFERNASPEQVHAAYQARFGASLDDDYEAYKRGRFDTYTGSEVKCVAPLAPRTADGAVILDAELDCGSSNVLNDFGEAVEGNRDRGIVSWTFIVEPEQAGAFSLTGGVDADTRLSIQRCVPVVLGGADLAEIGPWAIGRSLVPPDPSGRTLFLGPGLHRISWYGRLGVGSILDAALASECTFELQDCADGEQCTIWNSCDPEVMQPAAFGEACDQLPDGPRACAAGARCLAGTCVAECDASVACPNGEGCARIRVCGKDCNLVAQNCEAGFTCVPSETSELLATGQGQCIPSGSIPLFGGCDERDGGCGTGLSCEAVAPFDADFCNLDNGDSGCCLQLCDPSIEDPGCPPETPTCDPLVDGVAGVCRH